MSFLFPRIHMVSLFDGGSVAAVTCTAPTNIAVVKYWGKRDVALNLPINSSVSVTLDQSDLRTVTCVAASVRRGVPFRPSRLRLGTDRGRTLGHSRVLMLSTPW